MWISLVKTRIVMNSGELLLTWRAHHGILMSCAESSRLEVCCCMFPNTNIRDLEIDVFAVTTRGPSPPVSRFWVNDLFTPFSFWHRILALEKLGAVFNQVAFPLQYTPRKFVIHPESNNLIIIETDHNAYTEATKAQRKQQMAEVMRLPFRAVKRLLCETMLKSLKLCNYWLFFVVFKDPSCFSVL